MSLCPCGPILYSVLFLAGKKPAVKDTVTTLRKQRTAELQEEAEKELWAAKEMKN